MNEVTVSAGDSRYPVIIGKDVLHAYDTGPVFAGNDRCGVLVSETVYSLHGEKIDSFAAGIKNAKIVQYPDSERNKSYQFAEEFFKWMLAEGFTRHSVLVSIGGGVTGDFGGYLSAFYMRGIDIVQVPTTLLSMVDSSVGGKVAVNISGGKNIVGSFHQPVLVLADVSFLNTLPLDEFKNGIAEIVKHALIGDSASVKILASHTLDSIVESDDIIPLVQNSVEFKASVVAQDEREGGIRAILNYGHTIGHAIESLVKYEGVSHGQAVAMGLLVESELSLRSGLLDKHDYSTIKDIIDRYALIPGTHTFDTGELVAHLKYDKKNVGDEIRFVLLNGIGKPVYNQLVDDDLLFEVLNDHYGK